MHKMVQSRKIDGRSVSISSPEKIIVTDDSVLASSGMVRYVCFTFPVAIVSQYTAVEGALINGHRAGHQERCAHLLASATLSAAGMAESAFQRCMCHWLSADLTAFTCASPPVRDNFKSFT